MNCTNCGAPIVAGSVFCEKCGQPVSAAPAAAATPVVQSVQATSAQPAAVQPPLAPASSGSSGGLWMAIGCGCLALVLVIITALAIGGVAFKDKIKDALARITQQAEGTIPAAEPGSEPSSTPSASTPATAGTVRVELSWNKPVDMDLEIWDAAGENLKKRSFNLCGEDVTDGTTGNTEFFDFKSFDSGDDFSSGRYVVSIYFAARSDDSIEAAEATVTITKADGSTVVRKKVVNYEPGKDQWHAFKINAATGEIEDIDRFIRVTTNNNND